MPETDSKFAFVLGYIRAHHRLARVRAALGAALSGDPWSLPSLFGLRNWFPIRHPAKKDRPVTVQTVAGPIEAYVVEGTHPVPTRTRKWPAPYTQADMDAFNADIEAAYRSQLEADRAQLEAYRQAQLEADLRAHASDPSPGAVDVAVPPLPPDLGAPSPGADVSSAPVTVGELRAILSLLSDDLPVVCAGRSVFPNSGVSALIGVDGTLMYAADKRPNSDGTLWSEKDDVLAADAVPCVVLWSKSSAWRQR